LVLRKPARASVKESRGTSGASCWSGGLRSMVENPGGASRGRFKMLFNPWLWAREQEGG
jgi:hypothetical protein